MFLMKRGSPQNTLSTRSSSQSTSENGMLPTDVLNVSSSGPSCHFNSSSVELMREITSLEVEIMHLERYLLSLYRTSFEQHLPTLLENKGAHLPKSTGPPFRVREDQSYYESEPTDLWKGGMASPHQTSFPRRLAGSDFLSPSPPPKASSDMEKANIGHRSLADHFGASCLDNAIMTPDRLSEGLVKCISAIYCKLANPSSTHTGFSASSTSSLSSSNTFSPRNLSGSWSPHFTGEATGNVPLEGFKEDTRQRATMIEVSKISLDDDSFNYAAIMLQKFRSLVKRLEKVDPGKMKREEKLAFWINIHNALFMHAYLAYGTHNHVRGTSILKAAYNVGGHYVNACIIQRSILGIRLHYSLPRLQTLLSPGKKFKMGSTKHVYAIEYPEPLVHFALCSGEFSDPSVRVYKAKSVFQDLKLAKEEFVQASIYIHKETKILLPKILDYFAKDMSLDVPGLLKVVNDCLSEVQQKAIIKCIKGRVDKYVLWLPQRSTFRYLIHRELVEGIISG
ncbi:uncharacterized protein LOC131330761 isoform X5 [Rhododendron vialii]|uniref:uncharacterized protein LOC131330761 isoform X5 n=1 Tax=Rhododendron vialii TaxID=182163 RepID=UPI00265F9D87|nr:uncharacterized protein LOC131330761 isoform X5 [Rhododendron vialii]